MSSAADVLADIGAALGRSAALAMAPSPPVIDQPATRLVHTEFGLGELFTQMARNARMSVDQIMVDELPERLCQFLSENGCRKIAMANSAFLEKLGLPAVIARAGFSLHRWGEITLDSSLGMDCAITNVYAAIAETGSLVLGAGGALALIPPTQVVIVQPKDCLPDLLDLMEKLAAEGGGDTVLISGPGSMDDMGGGRVTGNGRPGLVRVFMLQ